MASNRWIGGMKMRQGALHRALGLKADTKITGKDLGKAMKSKSSRTRKEAVLAKTLKSFKK